MSKYVLKTLIGHDNAEVTRIDEDKLRIKIGGKETTVFTEDLAALIRSELPEDRAREMFSEVEEKMVQKGKARVVIRANKDIKKDDPVVFSIDIAKYIDKYNSPVGMRLTKSGFLLP